MQTPREYYADPWAQIFVNTLRSSRIEGVKNTLTLEQVGAMWMACPAGEGTHRLIRDDEAGPYTLENCRIVRGSPWHEQAYYCEGCRGISTHLTRDYVTHYCSGCGRVWELDESESQIEKELRSIAKTHFEMVAA